MDSSFPIPIVRVIVSDEAGRVLVLRRAFGSTCGGRWCLPGGKVDYGESVEGAARRELWEETGLRWESGTFLFYQDSPPSGPGEMHGINLVFGATVSGSLELNPDESIEARWIGADEVADFDLAFLNDRALQRYFAAQLG